MNELPRKGRSLRAACSVTDNDQGQAALEGVLAVAVLGGVFLASLFLAQWGLGLQSAHMGARLLAFEAGDYPTAAQGKPANHPLQNTDADLHDGDWGSGFASGIMHIIHKIFSQGDIHGQVTGTTRGRVPGQSTLFSYASKVMGYHADYWASSDPWKVDKTAVKVVFYLVAWFVAWTAHEQPDPEPDYGSGPGSGGMIDWAAGLVK